MINKSLLRKCPLFLYQITYSLGATTKLVSENKEIQKKIKEALRAVVHITACKACADQLGVTEDLERLGIEVIYWGVPLTDILKNDEKLLTI